MLSFTASLAELTAALDPERDDLALKVLERWSAVAASRTSIHAGQGRLLATVVRSPIASGMVTPRRLEVP